MQLAMQKYLNADKLVFTTPWNQENVNVFILLDYADKEKIVSQTIAKWPPHETVSLYIGTKDVDDEGIGPHLIKVTRGGSLLQWFLEEGADYGILLFSEGDIELLADHLRPFLECVLPDGRRKMFRFYDPISFYYFIPSLTKEELRLFMGPACGVACTRHVCANKGNSLFVGHGVPLEMYAPPTKRPPWFISEASFAALEIPLEYSLTLALTGFFYNTQRVTAKRMGKESVTNFARKIIEQNREFGLSKQRSLKRYLTLVSYLGIGYQHDPQFQHIAKAVQEAQSPEDALQALSIGVDEFRAKTRGRDDEYYHAALQRVLNISYDAWNKPDNETEVAAMLATLYPERYEYAGEKAILDLVKIAKQEVQIWDLPMRPGISILAGLMFFLGVDCLTDPLQPWIAKTLYTNIHPTRKVRDFFDMGRR